jgi:hypothetical protein
MLTAVKLDQPRFESFTGGEPDGLEGDVGHK